MITFSLSSLFAGISGILYTNWGGYITPSSMGLIAAAMPVIWVAASGKNDFFSFPWVYFACLYFPNPSNKWSSVCNYCNGFDFSYCNTIFSRWDYLNVEKIINK